MIICTFLLIWLQNDDIEVDNLSKNEIEDSEIEILTEEEKINDLNLDETGSEIRNWSSLLNDDLDTLMPKYNCVSISKEKEQNDSEVKLELEGKARVFTIVN